MTCDTQPADPELTAITSRIAELEHKLSAYKHLQKLTVFAMCANVIRAVCAEFDITKERMLLGSKQRTIAMPRMVAMMLCRELAGPLFRERVDRIMAVLKAEIMPHCESSTNQGKPPVGRQQLAPKSPQAHAPSL